MLLPCDVDDPVIALIVPTELIVALMSLSSGLVEMPVITTWRAHGNLERFPALAAMKHFHGSSRNQQLESHR